MVDWVRRALQRRLVRKDMKKDPSDALVYGVKFAMVMTFCLSGIEIANMAFLHTWNSEVFSSISGLIGLVTGIFIGHRA